MSPSLIKFSFIICFLSCFNVNAKNINIGTGSTKALAYPVMSEVCRFYHQNKYSIAPCNVISTKGSKENLDNIETGYYDMGVMKASMQYDEYHKYYQENGYSNLRTLFGLHIEHFTIIAKKDININSFFDLKGKRVNIPNPGSGSRLLYDKMAKKWDLNDNFFSKIYEEEVTFYKDLFCSDKIDAAIYFVGHPNKAYAETLAECNTKLVSISKEEISELISLSEYYAPSVIALGTYKNHNYNIGSFGAQLVLAASSELDQEIVYNFVASYFDNFKTISKNAIALKKTNPLQIFRTGGVAPIHEGAVKYYQEKIFLNPTK